MKQTFFRLVIFLTLAITGLSAEESVQMFPDIVGVSVKHNGTRSDFSVTISSPYDSPSRYADAFRLLDENGNELGIRLLLHDHANEQPFTRSLLNVDVPGNISKIIVQARDKRYGWGGKTHTIDWPL